MRSNQNQTCSSQLKPTQTKSNLNPYPGFDTAPQTTTPARFVSSRSNQNQTWSSQLRPNQTNQTKSNQKPPTARHITPPRNPRPIRLPRDQTKIKPDQASSKQLKPNQTKSNLKPFFMAWAPAAAPPEGRRKSN
jgi:hypothetical protein